MILRLPKSDLRMRGGNARRLSTEISAPVAGRISTSFIKVRLMYLNVTRAAWTAMELARIHSQLQGSSARPSHFLDAETCEFPSLSMLPV